MFKTFSIGFIGAGINSEIGKIHQCATEMDSLWKISAGCFSNNKKINQMTGKRLNLQKNKIYNTYEELINKEKNLDAVLIATPTPSHFKIIEKILKKKIPVICEKSFVTSVDEFKKIKKLIKKNFVSIIYNYTGYPMIQELQKIINKKDLGVINKIHVEMPSEAYLKKTVKGKIIKPKNWRLKDGKIPMVSLDLGVHIHHLIYYLTKFTPKNVLSINSTHGNFKNIVDDTFCLVKYNNFTNGVIWFSKSAIGHRNGLKLRVYGNKASVEWEQIKPEVIKFYKNDGKINILDRENIYLKNDLIKNYRFKAGHPSGFLEAFANHYKDIYNEIKFYKKNKKVSKNFIFGPNHAEKSLKFFEAVQKSNKLKKWIKI